MFARQAPPWLLTPGPENSFSWRPDQAPQFRFSIGSFATGSPLAGSFRGFMPCTHGGERKCARL
jgi:hypothetical protein